MTLEPRDLQDGNCNDCDFWRSRISRKKGVHIPGGYGKCTRPEGHCAPDIVRGGIGQYDPQFKTNQIREIQRNLAEENKTMAKRDMALLRKTAIEPEVMEEETQEDTGLLDQSPPDYSALPPLSAREQKRRAELEGVITRNFKAFYEVGCALREIREKMLYRNTHQRFDWYCKDLWEMARRTAYQFIDAADVVDLVKLNVRNCAHGDDAAHGQHENAPNWGQGENVRNCAQIAWIPENECQARALAPFKEEPDKLLVLVEEAVKTAPEGKITASHIRRTTRRLHLEKVKEVVTTARKNSDRAPKISEDFRKAFNNFLDQINIERAEEYRHTDHKEVTRHVRIILEALEAEL